MYRFRTGREAYRSDQDGSLGGVVAQCPWLDPLTTELPDTADTLVGSSGQVGHTYDLVLDVE